VRIHLACEHAAELEQLELSGYGLDLSDHVTQRARVLLLGRELVKLAGLIQRLLDALQRRDDRLELGTLSA
jgi:hypothetical protein